MTEPLPARNSSRFFGSAFFWFLTVAAGVIVIAWFFFSRTAREQTVDKQPISQNPDLESASPVLFRDVTAKTNVEFTYRNGEEANHFSILETLGGGVALLDYDGDGLLDIFVVGGGYFAGHDKKDIRGHPCKLYRNLGNWKFEDVSARVGFSGPWFYSHGVAVADYDLDGWPDLLITGYGRIALFRNVTDGRNGRKFEDVTRQLNLRDDSWSSSAGWADLDGDGYPDLYVCHYIDWSFANHPICKSLRNGSDREVCPPQYFKPLVHALYRNLQGKSFEDLTGKHKLEARGCGLGVVLGDLNDDGRPDIYVGNDATLNFLYFNRPHGILEERAGLSGTAGNDSGHYDGSMGVDFSDYDGSGRPSIFVTNFQGDMHALYKNLGRETFQHYSRASGLSAIGMQYVGFGTGFFDVDNDGWEDLIIVNGHVLYQPMLGSTYKQRPRLLRNIEFEGRRFYKDVSEQGGPFFQMPTLGRGLAIGDFDNDGWPDLVISHTNSPLAILRNEAATSIPHHWCGIKLVGKDFRDVVGSTVIVEGSARTLTRFAKGGGSYLSSSDRRLLFGLGASERIKRVTVKWSWGQTETWDNIEPDIYWELHEGQELPQRQFPVKK